MNEKSEKLRLEVNDIKKCIHFFKESDISHNDCFASHNKVEQITKSFGQKLSGYEIETKINTSSIGKLKTDFDECKRFYNAYDPTKIMIIESTVQKIIDDVEKLHTEISEINNLKSANAFDYNNLQSSIYQM